MGYYLLLCFVALLDGVRTLINKQYVKHFGSDFNSALLLSALTCGLFLPVALLTGGEFAFTPTSFALALVFAVINVLCSVFGFMVLGIGNMSVYILFLYMGGMLLPFAYGLLFHHDSLSLGKVLCILLVLFALLLNLSPGEKRSKKATLYYLLIFVFNGLACVVLSLHQTKALGGEIVSSTSFTMLYAALTSFFCLLILCVRLAMGGKKATEALFPESSKGAKALAVRLSLALLSGAGYGFGNALSTVSLLHVTPSAQFPFLTGGCILMSGICGLFIGEKLTKKFILSTAAVMMGCVLLFLAELGIPVISFSFLN